MIKVNGNLIEQERFGDNTLKCSVNGISARANSNIFGNSLSTGVDNMNTSEITWCYDSDDELFTLACIVDTLRDRDPLVQIILTMPYIPNARQDRCVSGRLFTLKTFAKIINSMNFYQVKVLDPHSDVSTALIDRVVQMNDIHHNLECVAIKKAVENEHNYQIMYPDNGAAKKYNATDDNIVGVKHRNEEGRINSYSLYGIKENTKSVLIIDDLCSWGGTFVSASKELRKHGVENVYLCVSHCENNILKGEVFDYVDGVFTTDSICTVEHPKLNILRCWR